MDENEVDFLQFVMSIVQQGMMCLGEIENPMTKKKEVSLDGVKQTIGLLEMLREKTQGNLEKSEERFLARALSDLQARYVEKAGS